MLFVDIMHDEISKLPEPDNRWQDSPYGPLKDVERTKRGKVVENIVARLLTQQGRTVQQMGTTAPYDLLVNGRTKVEVKLSMAHKNGQLRFRQVRDQGYDWLALVGITPERATLWLVPKHVAMPHTGDDHEAGGSVRAITFHHANVPEWLKPYESWLV